MKNRRTYLLRTSLFLLLGVLFAVKNSTAQRSVGIIWEFPENSSQTEEDLSWLKEVHTDYIIVDHPVDTSGIALLNKYQIPFLIKMHHRFLTEKQFLDQSEYFKTELNDAFILYENAPSFRGIIGFSNSLIDSTLLQDFPALYEIISDSLQPVSVKFGIPLKGTFFDRSSDSYSLKEFKDRINDETLILTYEWLKQTTEQFPDLEFAMINSNKIDPLTIPVPQTTAKTPLLHWSILVLLLLWISLAVNIKLNPTYLETIPRYFLAHRFFTDDILSYRERSSMSASFLLFQHAFFGGLTIYILSKTFITNTGLEAFYFHLPYLAITGQNYFSLFVLTSVLVFLVEIIALFWLYIPNSDLTHFNQALNLFTWIFHVDFVLITIMVTLFFAGAGAFIVSIFAIIYLVTWFASFNITAFSGSKRLGMKRSPYLFKTIFLHTIVSLSVLVLLLYYNGWMDILDLVVSI